MDMRLKFLSDNMRAIDFGMLSTRTESGAFASRPMSNNGEVDYDGDSYFFTYDQARTVADIAVQGNAELIRDKAMFAAHWTAGLDHWFEQGVDTPGLVMIRVRAARIHYWNGADQGEIVL
jgi:general stress protein 26